LKDSAVSGIWRLVVALVSLLLCGAAVLAGWGGALDGRLGIGVGAAPVATISLSGRVFGGGFWRRSAATHQFWEWQRPYRIWVAVSDLA